MKQSAELQIKNSTAEFLIFTSQSGKSTIEVRVEEGTVWLTQKLMAELFDVETPTINVHLKNLYNSKELNEEATIRDFLIVQNEGGRDISRTIKFYNLDAIIAVGFRVNSEQAVSFRQWAIQVLRDFSLRGYVIDKERMKNGSFLNESYYDRLLDEIREIRASERRFYQKITDIYATAMDYNSHSPTTNNFFASVQNKLHFAIHGNTAAELIMNRADSEKNHMGLTTWKNAPDGKIIRSDVVVAKNYLTNDESKQMNLIVSMYLDYAEMQAKKKIPMTMQDWADKLNAFLKFNEQEVLEESGKVTAEIAKAFAESEFENFRVVQDQEYESDFDRMIRESRGEYLIE
ncbi:MAG: virulence RhuM family protein [Methanimicrococcus sp.]|nr:virulence RhuM family protein [Methanimicrococcus sp.]